MMGRNSKILAKESFEPVEDVPDPHERQETLERETTHQEGDILPLRSHILPPFGPKLLSVRAPEIWIPLHDAKVHVNSCAGLDEG